MEVDFDKKTLGQLLKNPLDTGDIIIKIPQFQRKFVWEKEDEVLRLLEDFFSNLGERYFFGPIIILSGKSDNEIVYIVDGQQRIITFILLARALMDILELKRMESKFPRATNIKIGEFIHRFKELILRGGVINPDPRLIISKRINDDFQRHIIKDENPKKYETLKRSKRGEITAYKNIKQAYIKIFEYLKDYFKDYQSEEEFIKDINKIYISLENN